MKSIFVELPANEARDRWLRAARSTKDSLLSRGGFALEFIPAQGGCVIAMLPRRELRPRTSIPVFHWVAERVKDRFYDGEIERIERVIRG